MMIVDGNVTDWFVSMLHLFLTNSSSISPLERIQELLPYSNPPAIVNSQ